MDISYKDLIIFTTICEEESFTKASETLFISQPTLSKAIQRLENEFNTILLQRTSRTLAITDSGEIFYKRSKEAIRLMNSMKLEIDDFSDEISGEIKVGIPQIIGTVFFSSIAKEFTEKYPKVYLDITEEGGLIVEKLIEKENLSMGLCVLPTKNSNLSSQLIFEDEFVICVPSTHKFANYTEISLRKLMYEGFIIFDKSFALNRTVINACKQAGFYPKILFESSQWDFILELVSSNIGVTIIPRILYNKLNNVDIVPIRIKDTDLIWQIGIVTKKQSNLSNASKKLIEVIHELHEPKNTLG